MSDKIQLRGHCPHCCREQAVLRGGMAKHGYTVDYGYFNGTCSGSDSAPLETPVGQAESADFQIHLELAAKRIDAREFSPPPVITNGYKPDSRWYKEVSWELASAEDRRKCEALWLLERDRNAKAHRQLAAYLAEHAPGYAGKPLLEVKVGKDPAKVISVGDRIKCGDSIHVVTRIDYKVARGVGPGINGQCVEHVFWKRDDGSEWGYPKRYVKKVPA